MEIMSTSENIWSQQSLIRQAGAICTATNDISHRFDSASFHCLQSVFSNFWLLIKLGMLKEARFTPPREWRAVWLVWPFLVFTLLNLDSVISGHLEVDTSRPALIILFIFLNLSIGFAEEVMARGVVLNLLLRNWGASRRGIFLAVLVSALLFGSAHIFNVISGHLPPLATLTQIG